ncbi:unnamed protein product [Linum tenue]|uniref:TIR domain-containing protein n=1 Tax=Linum tenue TaxID=586396 RepID=A0AAV0QHK2_9ROSI|nr:unnamed protein product [Linum tenue]
MLLQIEQPNPTTGHDVFISFRGSDVRDRFVAHLRAALHREGVTSFLDDDSRHLPRGENLEEAIPRAIERSRISVVVLSRNYATSEWCLDELVTIMRCCTGNSTVGSRASQVAIPIFYHLPEELSGCYQKDLDRHKRTHTYERVDGWLRALDWVARIAGWVVPAAGRSEARLVEKIARAIRWKMDHKLVMMERDPSADNGRNHMNMRIITIGGATVMIIVIIAEKNE